MSQSSSSTTNHRTLHELQWTSLDQTRHQSSPQSLCQSDAISSPQLAKDEDYAQAIIHQWRTDVTHDVDATVGAPFSYIRTSDDTTLHGYLVMRSKVLKNTLVPPSNEHNKLPTIILFHTGAGPQDVSLRWKADLLARNPIWGPKGCIVLIADLLSDSTGWTWTERSKYDKVRTELLSCTTKEGQTQRWKLRESIDAALDALVELDLVDEERIAALGFCLGGHPILELGRMNRPGVQALVTFHGVFDGMEWNPKCELPDKQQDGKKVLICNGKSDPFVKDSQLEAARNTFETNGWKVELLNLDGVKHGFTNPAQDYNPSEAFAYDEGAAQTSWLKTIDLLKERMVDDK